MRIGQFYGACSAKRTQSRKLHDAQQQRRPARGFGVERELKWFVPGSAPTSADASSEEAG